MYVPKSSERGQRVQTEQLLYLSQLATWHRLRCRFLITFKAIVLKAKLLLIDHWYGGMEATG